ncbi:hypothetical protein QE152_g7906 [Popillia japonica]|uniref:Uncharacterized protein n=1 Tax=Popillia japonica TaxID=7064 RepID=A0AAW1MCH6_POPJA
MVTVVVQLPFWDSSRPELPREYLVALPDLYNDVMGEKWERKRARVKLLPSTRIGLVLIIGNTWVDELELSCCRLHVSDWC